MGTLFFYLAAIVAAYFVFVPHEFAHGYVAYRCGDPTAKMSGRLTFNPIKHIDPAGAIMCVLTGFGWAKPVPIYPYNFRNYRRGMFLTAIAGVVVNYIIAFIAYPLYLLFAIYVQAPTAGLDYLVSLVTNIFFLTFSYSLSIFVFNLLPLYPLDGFRVIEAFTRPVNPVHRFLKNYGQYILIGLVIESFLCNVLVTYAGLSIARYFNILSYVLWFARNILGFPIYGLWNTVFGLGINFFAL